MSITVTFPDGSESEYEDGVTPLQVAEGISEGLASEVLIADVNGERWDLTRPLPGDCELELLKWDDERAKEVFWHTSAHILAQAVERHYPDAKPTIGPPLDEGGFYYDFANLDIGEEDLETLEEEMLEIAREDFESQRVEYDTKNAAKEAFASNEYKQAIIEESDEELSAYEQGEFIDLCRGPHLDRTGYVKAAWLHKLAGAYWRGDADNEQLTRIYGITFPSEKELDAYKKKKEEAEKRDHRKLGKQLDLYGFDETSPGSPIFYPRGAVVYNELLSFLREEYEKRGYDEVITPLLYEKSLWEQSGHWEHYQDDMFIVEDGDQEYGLKPMNCPSHCLIYNRTQHSYRDLPVRIADFAPLHRNELRGVLGGLTRVRKFSQDDAHIFCTEQQVQAEVADCIDFTTYIYRDVMSMEFDHVELSTRPEKYLGEEAVWDRAEQSLKDALDANELDYVVNEGDGAFYGPKIDFHIKDALGRTWQMATIQLDFNLPERFSCTYTGEDNDKHQTVMIHRALLGSLERFIGVLMEHYAGKLPLWLSPEQVRVLAIADRHADYAQSVVEALSEHGLRAEVDVRDETVSKKVRDAQLDQVPYILVVGDNEVEAETVNVRTRDEEVHGEEPLEEFARRVSERVAAHE